MLASAAFKAAHREPQKPSCQVIEGSSMQLSIIIPTLNERPALERTLPDLLELSEDVRICDGGSHDGGDQVAQDLGATVVRGEAQRGGQLNQGAAEARGDLLLFLHADTVLPAETPRLLAEGLEDHHVGGGFFLRFDDQRPILRLAGHLINTRSRLSRCPLGDQALFVRRSVFHEMQGFRPWPILEDLDFSRRLKKQGPTLLIRQPVVTSARRYLAHGIVRQVLTNWLIFGLYYAGVSPHRLARLYRRRPVDKAALPKRHESGQPPQPQSPLSE